MVEPSLDSKIRAIPGIQAIVVTPGSSNREKAVAVIAGKLGISPDAVADDTDLGDDWRKIGSIVAQMTNQIIVSREGMKAGELLALCGE
jgi:hypothetical protein